MTYDGERFHVRRKKGYVRDSFFGQQVLERKLHGHTAIGQVRYSTTGRNVAANRQPLFAEDLCGGFALAHNGNLTNAGELREQLSARNAVFQIKTDTEVILHLLAQSEENTLVKKLIDALCCVEGAFSLVALTKEGMIGVRDPRGVWPLVLGKLGAETYILASESCELDVIGASKVRDIRAGEMVIIDSDGCHFLFPFRIICHLKDRVYRHQGQWVK